VHLTGQTSDFPLQINRVSARCDPGQRQNRREVVSKSDPLDRPATPEEIEMVERLLKRTRPAKNVVPLPKARTARTSSTEVLALPVMPLLPPKRRSSHFDFSDSSVPGAVVLQFVDPKSRFGCGARIDDRQDESAREGCDGAITTGLGGVVKDE
jgi:hypothetical protein